MRQSLDQFEKFLHGEADIPPLIRLALIHYQFEAIHPFRDGNGRIGRLLLALLLCDWKLLSKPLLYLIAYFDSHGDEYFDHLLAISLRGTWNDWIACFLRGVAEQAADAAARAQQLLALRERFREVLQKTQAPGACFSFVERLFELPAITVPVAASHLKLTYPGAKRNVLKLVKLQILKESSESRRPRLYVTPEILKISPTF